MASLVVDGRFSPRVTFGGAAFLGVFQPATLILLLLNCFRFFQPRPSRWRHVMRSFIQPNTNSTVFGFGQGRGLDMGIDKLSSGLPAQTLYLRRAGRVMAETAQRITRCLKSALKSAVAEAVHGMHSMCWMLSGPEPIRQPVRRASHALS